MLTETPGICPAAVGYGSDRRRPTSLPVQKNVGSLLWPDDRRRPHPVHERVVPLQAADKRTCGKARIGP
jgi:hypothetical protein